MADPVFSLAPGLDDPDGILNYKVATDARIYSRAVEPLFETKYALSSDGLAPFLIAFDDRAVEFGWEHIISIPKDIVTPYDNLVLLTTMDKLHLSRSASICGYLHW